jgi:hypothetical protein
VLTDPTHALIEAAGKLDEPSFVKRFPAPVLVLHDRDARGPNGIKRATVRVRDAIALTPTPLSENPMGEPSRDFRIEPLVRAGRSPFDDVIALGRSPVNDVVLDHPTVSRVHAFFWEEEPGVWWVADQRAVNGTFVQGQRLNPGEPRRCGSNDLLCFGEVYAVLNSPGALYRFLGFYAAQTEKTQKKPKIDLPRG